MLPHPIHLPPELPLRFVVESACGSEEAVGTRGVVGSPSLLRERATKPIGFQVKHLLTGSPKERGLRRPECLRGVGPADAPVPLRIRHIHRAEEGISASVGRRRASFMQHSDCTLRQEAVL
jgi:hypothetical protein